MDSLWPFLMMIATVYGALILLLFFTQSRLLYYPDIPSRQILFTPDQAGLSYETVEIVTEDGVKLHGWFLPAEKARGTLLFFHGNAGNISHRLDSLKIFHELNLEVLIFDYRGYGRSEGEPTEKGTYRDAEAAWRYLTEQRGIPARNILFFGRSLGAAIAARMASRKEAIGLILESAFTSVPDMAANLYPFLPARWLARFRYDTRAYLGSVSAPVLVVHSREDEIIPFENGRKLFTAAKGPKQFLELHGGHNEGFLVNLDTYQEGLDEFIQSCLTARY
jgi:hypothetical protein